MASEMPPTDTEQPRLLSAQFRMRLLWRLAAWGGAAALSLAVAVIVSQTGSGNKRLQLALFGPESAQTAGTAVAMNVAKGTTGATGQPMSDAAVDKLAAVERNTAATRAETKRLAKKVNELTADSFRFTGRLANLEHEIDGITGSIKEQAKKAAADAVARALPANATHDDAFDKSAPAISAPATALPKLSLLKLPKPGAGTALVHDRARDVIKPAPIQDVTVTSAIKSKPTDEASPTMDAKAASKGEAKSAAKTQAKMKMNPNALADEAVRRAKEAEAAVAAEAKKGMPKAQEQIALEPEADAKMESKSERKTAKPGRTKMAKMAAPAHRRIARRWSWRRHGYGVDIGGADSVTVVKAEWAAVKANFGPMLVGLRPTAVRNHRFLTNGAFRLVIGRLRSRKSAERLCARFAKQQVSCRPIQFDGERVIWH